MRRNSAKLSFRHKLWLYSTLVLVYSSGAVWTCLHYLFPSTGDSAEPARLLEPWSLKAHGAGAMIFLIILGTLLPGHVRFSWHSQRNRPNGLILIMVVSFLIVSGYGLYYFGSESLRSWTSWSHLVIGFVLPAILIVHIWAGRRT